MSTLTFAEEILLLLLDDETGRIEEVPVNVMELLLSGAVVMDLAFRGRLDCDLEKLFLVDAAPTGEAILDVALKEIGAARDSRSPRHWIQRLSAQGGDLQEAALNRLVERGILKTEDTRVLWVFGRRRYPVVDDREEREVKLRIMDVLLSDCIPDPRDVALICLADSAGAFRFILSDRELRLAVPRIEQVSKLDLIGQAMTEAIRKSVYDISVAMAQAQHPIY